MALACKWPERVLAPLLGLYQPDARSAARADPLLVLLPRAGFIAWLGYGVLDSGWTERPLSSPSSF